MTSNAPPAGNPSRPRRERCVATPHDGAVLLNNNTDGRVLHANRTAESLTRRNDAVHVVQGRLEFRQAEARARFDSALAGIQKLVPGDPLGDGGDFHVARPTPCRPTSSPCALLGDNARLAGLGARHVAVLFIRYLAAPDGVMHVPIAREMFGLAEAEASLADALSRGISPSSYAGAQHQPEHGLHASEAPQGQGRRQAPAGARRQALGIEGAPASGSRAPGVDRPACRPRLLPSQASNCLGLPASGWSVRAVCTFVARASWHRAPSRRSASALSASARSSATSTCRPWRRIRTTAWSPRPAATPASTASRTFTTIEEMLGAVNGPRRGVALHAAAVPLRRRAHRARSRQARVPRKATRRDRQRGRGSETRWPRQRASRSSPAGIRAMRRPSRPPAPSSPRPRFEARRSTGRKTCAAGIPARSGSGRPAASASSIRASTRCRSPRTSSRGAVHHLGDAGISREPRRAGRRADRIPRRIRHGS